MEYVKWENIKKSCTAVTAFSKKEKRKTKRTTRRKKGKVSCLTLFTSNYGLIITKEGFDGLRLHLKCPAMTAINNIINSVRASLLLDFYIFQ